MKVTSKIGIFLLLAVSSCGSAVGPTIRTIDTSVADALPTVACVLTQLANGNTNAAEIGTACGGIAAASVVAILNSVAGGLSGGKSAPVSVSPAGELSL